MGLEWHFKFFQDLSVCLTSVCVTLCLCSTDLLFRPNPRRGMTFMLVLFFLNTFMNNKVFLKKMKLLNIYIFPSQELLLFGYTFLYQLFRHLKPKASVVFRR